MRKSPPTRDPALDIFEDEDLSRAQEALSAATEPEKREGEGRKRIAPVTVRKASRPVRPARKAQKANGTKPATVAPVEEAPEVSSVEATDAHLKFRVRQTTRAQFDSFKAELSCALGGARLMDSNIGRALLDCFLSEYGERVIETARNSPEVFLRPASDDLVAMAAFDEALRTLISDALRTAVDGVGPAGSV